MRLNNKHVYKYCNLHTLVYVLVQKTSTSYLSILITDVVSRTSYLQAIENILSRLWLKDIFIKLTKFSKTVCVVYRT